MNRLTGYIKMSADELNAGAKKTRNARKLNKYSTERTYLNNNLLNYSMALDFTTSSV